MKLANNTYQKDNNIRLHATDIITILPGGKYRLNSGGYRTVTTMDRLKRFAGAKLYTKNYVWYFNNGNIYYDGIIIKDGLPVRYNKRKGERELAFQRWLSKRIDWMIQQGLLRPDSGDCLLCRFQIHGCITWHLTERYLHGTLIINALAHANMQGGYLPETAVRRALKKFLRHHANLERAKTC